MVSILSIIGEILLAMLADVAVFGSIELTARRVEREGRAHPVPIAIMQIVLGSGLGWLAGVIVPTPPWHPVPGLSLLVLPLALGTFNHLVGAFWTKKSWVRPTTWTFWSGALFGLCFAAARFLTVAAS